MKSAFSPQLVDRSSTAIARGGTSYRLMSSSQKTWDSGRPLVSTLRRHQLAVPLELNR
ncbi:hypothetical protein [Kribbella steppae]|uniref:hypothetical protein n=1 Tax=Kribbella steppae TaxID=2512223 RepID=UPI00130E839C|nr:hypothetical protein [Kribbella steppae]